MNKKEREGDKHHHWNEEAKRKRTTRSFPLLDKSRNSLSLLSHSLSFSLTREKRERGFIWRKDRRKSKQSIHIIKLSLITNASSLFIFLIHLLSPSSCSFSRINSSLLLSLIKFSLTIGEKTKGEKEWRKKEREEEEKKEREREKERTKRKRGRRKEMIEKE